MAHEEYIREIPGSTQAVLLIHGILGTPEHFRDLLPHIPENWSVYNIRLEGHGGPAADFSHTSMARWKTQVHSRLLQMKARYQKIILVAHSMGTLFCIQEAVADPSHIQALFLLQVPLYPCLRLGTAVKAPLLAFGIVPKSAQLMYQDCGVILTRRLWQYLGWIPRFLELLVLCKQSRKRFETLSRPSFAFQSYKDELVRRSSSRHLLKNPRIQHVMLQGCGHLAYPPEAQKQMRDALKSLLEIR
jgi:esterase/lipase